MILEKTKDLLRPCKKMICDKLKPKSSFSQEEAAVVAKKLGIDFSKEKFSLADFTYGINVELEHGKKSSKTNTTNDNPIKTGKIALAHLSEFPDYYERLKKLEAEATAYWKNKKHN